MPANVDAMMALACPRAPRVGVDPPVLRGVTFCRSVATTGTRALGTENERVVPSGLTRGARWPRRRSTFEPSVVSTGVIRGNVVAVVPEKVCRPKLMRAAFFAMMSCGGSRTADPNPGRGRPTLLSFASWLAGIVAGSGRSGL